LADTPSKTLAARDAQHRRARTLTDAGRFEEAVAAYEALLAAHPEFGSAYFELAGILDQCFQRADLAVAQLTLGLERSPKDAASFANSLGVFKLRERDVDAAIAWFERAVAENPQFADPHANLGLVHYNRNAVEPALESYAKAVELAPNDVPLLHNYTLVLSKAGKGDEAIAVSKRAMKLDPRNATGWHNLGMAERKRGRLTEALSALQKSVALPAHTAVFHSDMLMLSLYDASLSQAQLFDAHKRWARCHAPKPAFTFAPRASGRRIRLGYVSADFRRHPVGHFLAPVVAAHNRARFEVFAYSSTENEDALTQHLARHCDHFVRVGVLDDQQLADRIHEDEIDILFDLSGHTAHNRLLTFALKPAPIQVSWLGYPFTTGLGAIDYFISDRCETPDGYDKWFTEKLIRMPDGYLCVQLPEYAPPVNLLPAFTKPYFTFGCFNNLSKLNDATARLWARVLHALPGSRLMLKAGQLADAAVAQATRERFAALGVAPGRLELQGPSGRQAYLQAYRRIDVALDPFPFPGGTTSVEGLWMGVPVLTRRGDRFIGHNGETIARNTGQADWIASDEDDYVDKARRLTADLRALAALRAGLRAQVLGSPLFDSARFARHFEAALWGMWEAAARPS